MSADGLPFIGRSGLDGFYINTGHGHIGWTQAVGSSILLADCLEGIQSKIDITAYNPNR
jgi:D-amino-acid dehydrogenase